MANQREESFRLAMIANEARRPGPIAARFYGEARRVAALMPDVEAAQQLPAAVKASSSDVMALVTSCARVLAPEPEPEPEPEDDEAVTPEQRAAAEEIASSNAKSGAAAIKASTDPDVVDLVRQIEAKREGGPRKTITGALDEWRAEHPEAYQ